MTKEKDQIKYYRDHKPCISLCENCIHKPDFLIPQTNDEVKNGKEDERAILCIQTTYAPYPDFDDNGRLFFDVAKCEKHTVDPNYVHYNQNNKKKKK